MERSGEDHKDETLPPGFRFHPTDEELITYYLTNKLSDSSFIGRAIADVDLNKSEPWDLPGNLISSLQNYVYNYFQYLIHAPSLI